MIQLSGKNIDRLYFVVFSSFVLLLVFGVSCYLRGLELLPEGPSLRNARVAISIWERGSIQSPEFFETHQMLLRLSEENNSNYWQDMYAMGRNGQLFPKHSLLVSVLAAPFYGLFGKIGFWIFNQIIIILLILSTYRIATFLCRKDLAITVVIIIVAFTQTLWVSYGLSYDILAAMLIICGLDLLRKFRILGAAMLSLSIFIRPSNVIMLPFLLVAWEKNLSWEGVFELLIGSGVIVGLFLFLNWLMFGDMLSTAYHRVLYYSSGTAFIGVHPKGFNISMFLSDWLGKLFSLKNGLITFNSILVLLPFSLFSALKSQHRFFYMATFASGLINCLFIFSYKMWFESFYGNRFLFPSIFLFLFPIFSFLSSFLPEIKRNKNRL